METYNLKALGTRIKAVRKAKKKTQDEIAQAVGIGKTTISEWERGLKQPGLLNMLNYCEYLGITLDELLEIKASRTLQLELTEEERDLIFSAFDKCEQMLNMPDINTFQQILYSLKNHLHTIFNRAHIKA
jgi:transcriptional regulator with XRE-family HTH domain